MSRTVYRVGSMPLLDNILSVYIENKCFQVRSDSVLSHSERVWMTTHIPQLKHGSDEFDDHTHSAALSMAQVHLLYSCQS